MEKNDSNETPARHNSPYVNVVLIAFLAIAAFFLIAEHWAHLYGYLSWLPLVAFVALHFWMHAGHRHGSHGSHGTDRLDPKSDRKSSTHKH